MARGLDPSPIAQYARAVGISRLTRVLVCASVVALALAPAAHARAGSLRTLTIRAPVPAAGDLSVVAFEMSIGGEGKHHHRQAVDLLLRNHRQTGVFALARLRPEPHHPGRFLGVLEVFHRASVAKVARGPGSAGLGRGSSPAPIARTDAGFAVTNSSSEPATSASSSR